MRILFITNYYPPSNYGWGYMQLCEEVADGLAAKGHEIAVLTSTRCDGPEIPRSYPVHHLLTIDPDWHSSKSAAWQFFVGRKQREQQAVAHLQALIKQFQPQVIFVWHAIGLPRVLLQAAEQQLNSIMVYYFAGYLPELPDEYIAYWQTQPVHPLAKAFKRPLAWLALQQLAREGKPIELDYKNVICVSDYVRRRLASQGLIPPESTVIYNGVDLKAFSSMRPHRNFVNVTRLLYAGRLEFDKGIHCIIEAFGEIAKEAIGKGVVLTIVGDGESEYVTHCQTLVQRLGLSDYVNWLPPVHREAMPSLLDNYDIFVLSSNLEALSRMMQEAMAMGLLVIGTTTGGSGELLVHEQTGLVFEAGNAHSLTQQLRWVMDEPDLVSRLAQAGQARVRDEFNIDLTVKRIENYLQDLVERQQ